MIKRWGLAVIYGVTAAGLLWFSWSYASVIEQGVLAATAGLGLVAGICAGASLKG